MFAFKNSVEQYADIIDPGILGRHFRRGGHAEICPWGLAGGGGRNSAASIDPSRREASEDRQMVNIWEGEPERCALLRTTQRSQRHSCCTVTTEPTLELWLRPGLHPARFLERNSWLNLVRPHRKLGSLKQYAEEYDLTYRQQTVPRLFWR